MAISRKQVQDARKALLAQQLIAENPQAVDMYTGGNMQQTLLNSNSPFALAGRGIGKVADAVLPTPAGPVIKKLGGVAEILAEVRAWRNFSGIANPSNV